jgi:manganese/zinc/iron transport system permease protein
MSNPYWGADFGSFLLLFFQRLGLLLTGKVPLASDEVQVLALMGIALSGALIGTFLVLRKMTMLANALSHTILLGIVGAFLLFSAGGSLQVDLKVMIVAALIGGLLTILLTQFFHVILKLQEDASIGIVFTALFALGILAVTLYTRNAHISTEVIMGNLDALHVSDLKVIGAVVVLSGGAVGLFYRGFKITAFDPGLARSLGFSPGRYAYLLMLLTSCVSVGAFRAVGVVLFLAFLVGPTLIARLFVKRLGKLLALSITIGALTSLLSVALSRHLLSAYQLPLSTSGLAATLLFALFILSWPFHRLLLGLGRYVKAPAQSEEELAT